MLDFERKKARQVSDSLSRPWKLRREQPRCIDVIPIVRRIRAGAVASSSDDAIAEAE
jgi:hypothetical protein